MHLLFSAEIRFAGPVPRQVRVGYQWSQHEVDELAEYLGRVMASKYAPDPANKSSVVFAADVGKASNAKYPAPRFLQIFTCDILYMPLAWRGDYDAWSQAKRWFLDLPPGTKRLPAVMRPDGENQT